MVPFAKQPELGHKTARASVVPVGGTTIRLTKLQCDLRITTCSIRRSATLTTTSSFPSKLSSEKTFRLPLARGKESCYKCAV